MSDEQMIMCVYESPNYGMHKVVGTQTKINYGYRAGGGTDRFYVHKDDIAARPDVFRPFIQPRPVIDQPAQAPLSAPAQIAAPVQLKEAPPAVELKAPDFIKTEPANTSDGPGQNFNVVFKPIDFQSIPGITDKIADALDKKGVRTWQDVVQLGKDGLLAIEGIGEKRADTILKKAIKEAE
jgi:predicted flap endonuclease-1-like 5' DNA nuclease